MAVVERGGLTGTIGNLFGPKTFRRRLGQNIVSDKPHPLVLKGLKNKTDEELKEIAARTGYSVDDLKKIREKQKKMKNAIETCRRLRDEGKLDHPIYNPRKPGETRFNRCVSIMLSKSETPEIVEIK